MRRHRRRRCGRRPRRVCESACIESRVQKLHVGSGKQHQTTLGHSPQAPPARTHQGKPIAARTRRHSALLYPPTHERNGIGASRNRMLLEGGRGEASTGEQTPRVDGVTVWPRCVSRVLVGGCVPRLRPLVRPAFLGCDASERGGTRRRSKTKRGIGDGRQARTAAVEKSSRKGQGGAQL